MVTGSEGLVGRCLTFALERHGYAVERMDLREVNGTPPGDIRDAESCRARAQGCIGIIHLAAFSRVVWGERDPRGCWQTNVNGTANVLGAARSARSRPWVLFTSSREVYGQPARMPTHEDEALQPVNLYGRSKAQGERLIVEARGLGLCTSIVRLSNVYGRCDDHADRVVPAFARAAAAGAPMTICGRRHTFDFTHLDDTVRGIVTLVEALEDGFKNPPPIQFVTGRPTTLGQLAELANAAGGSRSRLDDGPERNYDVAHFVGDPSRARELLGWQADIPVEVGVRRLVGQFLEAAKHVAPGPKVLSAAPPCDTAAATLGRPSA